METEPTNLTFLCHKLLKFYSFTIVTVNIFKVRFSFNISISLVFTANNFNMDQIIPTKKYYEKHMQNYIFKQKNS